MKDSLDANISADIWREKLNSELNYRCFSLLEERMANVDTVLRYALAFTSITTVVFWLLIDPSGGIWKWLSAISSLLAIVNATYGYQRKIECIIKVKYSYHKIWKDFEELWLKIQSRSIKQEKALATRKQLLDAFCEIDKTNIFHSVSKTIVKKCQKEVLKHNGIGG